MRFSNKICFCWSPNSPMCYSLHVLPTASFVLSCHIHPIFPSLMPFPPSHGLLSNFIFCTNNHLPYLCIWERTCNFCLSESKLLCLIYYFYIWPFSWSCHDYILFIDEWISGDSHCKGMFIGWGSVWEWRGQVLFITALSTYLTEAPGELRWSLQ